MFYSMVKGLKQGGLMRLQRASGTYNVFTPNVESHLLTGPSLQAEKAAVSDFFFFKLQ